MSDTLTRTIGVVFTTSPLLCASPGDAPGRSLIFQPFSGDDASAPLRRNARDNTNSNTRIADIAVTDLLARVRAGDREALGTIYTELFDGLWKFAVLHTRSPVLAMDVVQDVFLHFWIHRDAIKPETDIGVYLAVAIRNKAINRGKHQRVVKKVETAVTGTHLAIPAFGQAELAADARIEIDEFMAAYHRAVATLSEREQVAAFLRWEEGWPFERIGEVLSLSKVGARKLILRAQHKVQGLLEPYRG